MKKRIDAETRKRREALKKLQKMSLDEVFQLAVQAGIYTRSGKLTKRYRITPDEAATS